MIVTAICVVLILIIILAVFLIVRRVKERRLNNVEIEVIPMVKKITDLSQSAQKLNSVEELDDFE